MARRRPRSGLRRSGSPIRGRDRGGPCRAPRPCRRSARSSGGAPSAAAEVAVWLAGRFLGWLASAGPGRADAGDWRAEGRLLTRLGVARETARTEPARGLLDAELRVIELARAHVVERGASA